MHVRKLLSFILSILFSITHLVGSDYILTEVVKQFAQSTNNEHISHSAGTRTNAVVRVVPSNGAMQTL